MAGLAVLLLVTGAVYACNKYVENSSEAALYSSVEQIPANEVGLVLGTARNLRSGSPNPYFMYRVEAAAKLFHAGKVKYLIVSGDNGTKEYDEATDMRNALVKLGVPAERIYMDYAGFRTLDSVVRCREIFGQKSFTIISQKFHNHRAVFLAGANDLNAVAYNCRDINRRAGRRVLARESLARFKAVADVIFGTEPRFLGEKVQIGKPQTNTNDEV